ncbi:hypothetical protein N7532_002129 [Penicillium argentinense]|uniref:Fe2OG dioxygenase domain-containing protein n=1 Tax=Penicillium argentinense TaxID=1131581 RepID=A0A9W9G3S1_9EURO|nr:uncharacterized protein N7532_002129 [Penicillium argentinense]KAJ5111594.1 hypothetical protein N7532_002129 [Penicillium argentinense]
MSFFSFGDLPTIQTRKALLLLDYQNDFVRPAGALHVANTSDILETLPPLVAAFRRVGDVIWVRSKYESPQSLDDWNFGDRIVLEKEPPKREPLPSTDIIEAASDRDSPEPVDAEAFLSNTSPTCCVSQTTGFQFPAPILAAIDRERDTVLDKTGYSALESEGLVLSFRTRFITELYLCGSLSNVSVYATACDAVRNGFSVTLIEDCLGYRDFQRHQEAMRRMADILGATGLDAQELTQELDWQETHTIAKAPSAQPKRVTIPSGIESVMDSLGVQADDSSPQERPDEDGRSLMELASFTRSQRMNAAGSHARPPVEGKRQVRARVRRPKRRDPTDPETANEKPRTCVGEGDSRLIPELGLPADAFERIRAEVSWQKMYHLSSQVPRLVAVQGHIQPDGSIPIYRHPADESPVLKSFTPAVDQARLAVERVLGHPLNHVLIQLYRDGHDSISEHSDKTLDIVRGSFICNVSLGAQRIMHLRTKVSAKNIAEKDGPEAARATQRISLPHGSLFVLGEKTNMRWLHGIRPDKRPDTVKSPEEKAYGNERISLTFRHIGTYLDPAANIIWGQGAVGKTRDTARPVIHGDPAETERLIHSFGQENRATEFDWNGVYGNGFDVVNFVTTSPSRLALSGDSVTDLRVRLCLGESGIRYETCDGRELAPAGAYTTPHLQPIYIDSDSTTVVGDLNILKHLAERPVESLRPGVEVLRGGSQIPWIEEIFGCWRKHLQSGAPGVFEFGLNVFDRTLDGQNYLAGPAFGIDDCALWPVLREIIHAQGPFDARFPNLTQYYHRVEKRGLVRVVLEELR